MYYRTRHCTIGKDVAKKTEKNKDAQRPPGLAGEASQANAGRPRGEEDRVDPVVVQASTLFV
jgi:hypothetical protein